MAEAAASRRSADPARDEATRRGAAPGRCACAASPASAFACPRCRARARLNRFAAGPAPQQVPAIVHEVLARAGTPLDRERRTAMEQRFRLDFGQVRVHQDAQAQASARALQARAYTVGSHVVFGAGASDRGDPDLLAHELAHVVQQRGRPVLPGEPLQVDAADSPAELEAERWARASAGIDGPGPAAAPGPRLQRQPEPGAAPGEIVFDTPELCEGRQDVTDEFRRFTADAPDLIDAMPNLSDEQRRGLRDMARLVLHSEGAADIEHMQISSCTRINSDLATSREEIEAFVDTGRNEVAMLTRIAGLMQQIRTSPTPEAMTSFLQTIAHEKRHVTLGGAVDVGADALRPGRYADTARLASYRAEEILTTAEEIAVGRMALGRDFIVERPAQEKLYRLRNMIRGWITEEAWLELRGRIITQLRDRYGFEGGCDNALTLGVLSSMERNEWHACNRETGEVASRIPEGLNICTGDHSPCPVRSR